MDQTVGVPALFHVQATATRGVREASTGFFDQNCAGGEVPRTASVTDGKIDFSSGHFDDTVHRRFHEVRFGLQEITTAACISRLRPEGEGTFREVMPPANPQQLVGRRGLKHASIRTAALDRPPAVARHGASDYAENDVLIDLKRDVSRSSGVDVTERR